MKLREQLLEHIKKGPCSAEYLADVTRVPLVAVKHELAALTRFYRVEEHTLVTYRVAEIEDPRIAEKLKKIEQALQLNQATKAARLIC